MKQEFYISKSVLNAHKIAGVFLFGSQAQGRARPDSDFDFGVLLAREAFPISRIKRQKCYDALYELLALQIGKLVDLDIVFLHEADLQLRFHVIRDGQSIAVREPEEVANFIEVTMETYADFAPHRKVFHDAILARV